MDVMENIVEFEVVRLRNVMFIKKYFWPAGKVAKMHERNFRECPFK